MKNWFTTRGYWRLNLPSRILRHPQFAVLCALIHRICSALMHATRSTYAACANTNTSMSTWTQFSSRLVGLANKRRRARPQPRTLKLQKSTCSVRTINPYGWLVTDACLNLSGRVFDMEDIIVLLEIQVAYVQEKCTLVAQRAQQHYLAWEIDHNIMHVPMISRSQHNTR